MEIDEKSYISTLIENAALHSANAVKKDVTETIGEVEKRIKSDMSMHLGSLRDSMSKIESQVGQQANKVEALDGRVTALETTVKGLTDIKSSVERLDASISDMQTKAAKAEGVTLGKAVFWGGLVAAVGVMANLGAIVGAVAEWFR